MVGEGHYLKGSQFIIPNILEGGCKKFYAKLITFSKAKKKAYYKIAIIRTNSIKDYLLFT